jgi:hypothetical protein
VSNKVSGNVQVNVGGGMIGNAGFGFSGPGNGAAGFVRIEAFDTTSLSAIGNQASVALPNPVTAPNSPQLIIASVGGVSAPANPIGSHSGTPDIVLPANQANPVTVVVQASNIPVGTTVTVTALGPTGPPVPTQTGPLTGTSAASSATTALTLQPGTTVLTALASIDLTVSGLAATRPVVNGEYVNRIEVAAAFGGLSRITYVTSSGKRIEK